MREKNYELLFVVCIGRLAAVFDFCREKGSTLLRWCIFDFILRILLLLLGWLLLCRNIFLDFIELCKEFRKIPEGDIAEFITEKKDVVVRVECNVCNRESIDFFVHNGSGFVHFRYEISRACFAVVYAVEVHEPLGIGRHKRVVRVKEEDFLFSIILRCAWESFLSIRV